MAGIVITPRELLDSYLWDEFCNMRGINIWAMNEGLMSSDEVIILTEDEAIALGLINKDLTDDDL
jgi:hypothetical protein